MPERSESAHQVLGQLTDKEINVVKQYLEFPFAHLDGFQLRTFAQMGDRLAVAFANILYPIDQIEDLIVQKVLVALNVAFGNVVPLPEGGGSTPAVAACLLETLYSRATSESTRASVRAAMREIMASNRA